MINFLVIFCKMEFSFTSKYLYPTLLGDVDHYKHLQSTKISHLQITNRRLLMRILKRNEITRPMVSIGTSPEFKFGIMEWVTNWTFTITQTHFYCSFWTFWSFKVTLIMFFLNMVDYPVFFPSLSTLTWDTFLTLRGTWGFYLNHVLPPRPSKSYRVGGGVGGP